MIDLLFSPNTRTLSLNVLTSEDTNHNWLTLNWFLDIIQNLDYSQVDVTGVARLSREKALRM